MSWTSIDDALDVLFRVAYFGRGRPAHTVTAAPARGVGAHGRAVELAEQVRLEALRL